MRPPEEVKRELVQQWLQKAEEDFAVARYLLESGTTYWGAIGFHAQQAAEKFLKAYLVHQQIEFPKTHDIEELLDLLSRVDESLAASLRIAGELNPYGVEVRYPGDIEPMTPDEAEKAVGLASLVREAILRPLHRSTVS